MKRVIAISSQGGHWIEIKRLLPAFDACELILISTFRSEPSLVKKPKKYYSVIEASRWSKFNLVVQAFQTLFIILREQPDIVISTGASVGIWGIAAGRLVGAKTVWVDSIASYSQLSLSGKLTRKIASVHLTQWPHLAIGKTIYRGSVI